MKLSIPLASFLLAIACSSDPRPNPPSDVSGGSGGVDEAAGSGDNLQRSGAGGASGSPNDPGTEAGARGTSESGAGGALDASAAGDGGAAGVKDESSGPQYSCDPGTPPKMGSVCDPAATFGEATAVSVDGGGGARLIAVTPDELTLVWTSDGAAGVRFFYADRVTADDPFGPATQIITDDLIVGVSPDGLRVVTLAVDGSSYGELSREVRGYDFGAPSAAAFAAIDAAAAAGGVVYRDCVISADDHTLIYTALTAHAEEYPVRISTRTGSEPWPVGTPIARCELQRHGDLIRHPTGLSADGLTLIFYDPDVQHARAAWRDGKSAAFSYFTELDGVGRAALNASCNALYYSASPANVGLLVGTASKP